MLLALLVCANCTLSVQTVTFKGNRTERFLYGVAYYQKLADVKTRLAFMGGTYPGHDDYCAWVVRDPVEPRQTLIGVNDSNPLCQEYKPEWLALHEVCHLSMAHTAAPFDASMPPEAKEREVDECMRGYDARRGD